MTISSYSDLQTEVIDYTHRSDMASRVPTFIQLCEADMRSRLDVVDFEADATVTITSGTGSVPSDFSGMRACYWDGDENRALQYITPDLYNALEDDSGAYPAFYTITGTTIKVKPTGDGSLVMNYLARFTDLATTPSTLS